MASCAANQTMTPSSGEMRNSAITAISLAHSFQALK
jgi:hypothetical protein